jgi:hypothetical protein
MLQVNPVYVESSVSISNYPLSAALTCTKLCSGFEEVWGVVWPEDVQEHLDVCHAVTFQMDNIGVFFQKIDCSVILNNFYIVEQVS